MSGIQEKMTAALTSKDQGNEAFKNGDIKKALTHYHLAVLGLSGLDNQMSGMPMMSAMQPQTGMATDDQKNVIKTNLAVVYSNMGACHLKNNNYKRAIEVCDTALKHDSTNVKAKFRRAQAKLAEGNLAGAEADLNALGDKVPGVKAELEKLKKKSKDADEKQRKTMGGFLSRGRIISDTDPDHENSAENASAAASTTTTTTTTTTSSSTTTTPAAKTTPKSKPTLASKINSANANKKPPKIVRDEEYQTSSWSGTAPKIQELADGEE
ncbi:hypothetical protein BGX23_005653 [Mortierella sp. AD031]|nr:hypothetical protein BGX23_005653 [Mortierella sp. AD031]KAG0209081.1 hypothetical protein BGX33_005845 [Mortierella sp. NVP41]